MSPSALFGASAAVLILRSARGLGVGRLDQPKPEETERVKRAGTGYIEDAIASFRDADEDDAFDTWYFEKHAEDISGNPADEIKKNSTDWQWGKNHNVTKDDPTWRRPSKEELSTNDWAKSQCAIPKKGKPSHPLENGVITYLVTRPSDLRRLSESLPRLRYYFLQHWPYPVKVFVASDQLRQYDNESFGNSPGRYTVTKMVWELLGNDLEWQVTDFDVKFPKVIANDPAWKEKRNTCARAVSTSYKHMNQFFTMAMYDHPSLKDYQYYMRVDADFNFEAPMQADPFCMMRKSGRKFTWQTRKKTADGFCSDGLWEWFQKYQQDHGLVPQDPRLWRESGAMVNYVGYVGMGDLDFFRSNAVRTLARALNADGRVYLNRWSDQTYYVLLFALFANHSAVGDLGFAWKQSEWCHKCKISGTFDGTTGKIRYDREAKDPNDGLLEFS